jgi:hypothetical protein|uniref:Uncharacterized protein n=1 Tax=viral metagenome TaxID=1070528 RepID=A0A6C0BWZ2_9ZZZZ
MLSLTASIIETVVVKTTMFAVTQVLNLATYGTYSVYNWYNPTLTSTEILQNEVKLLRNELRELRETDYARHENRIIVLE